MDFVIAFFQWHKFPGLWDRVKTEGGWRDSLKVLLYGPSWISGVGAPRLGRDEDKVDVRKNPTHPHGNYVTVDEVPSFRIQLWN